MRVIRGLVLLVLVVSSPVARLLLTTPLKNRHASIYYTNTFVVEFLVHSGLLKPVVKAPKQKEIALSQLTVARC